MTPVFQQRDNNADGKLNREELPAVLFNRPDVTKDTGLQVDRPIELDLKAQTICVAEVPK